MTINTDIELETAILAKEKGFNPKYYSIRNWFDPIYNGGEKVNKALAPTAYDYNKHIAIVKKEVLQRWLRDKYDIDVLVDVGDNHNGKFYKVRVWFNGSDNMCYLTPYQYYEEALEEGLREALKYI